MRGARIRLCERHDEALDHRWAIGAASSVHTTRTGHQTHGADVTFVPLGSHAGSPSVGAASRSAWGPVGAGAPSTYERVWARVILRWNVCVAGRGPRASSRTEREGNVIVHERMGPPGRRGGEGAWGTAVTFERRAPERVGVVAASQRARRHLVWPTESGTMCLHHGAPLGVKEGGRRCLDYHWTTPIATSHV